MHISQASTLFEEYVRILNRIVAEYEDTPLGSLMSSDSSPIERRMVVALIAGSRRLEVEHFDVLLENGRFRITGRAAITGDKRPVWRLPLETVKETIEQEEHLRSNPQDLDLRWLLAGLQQQRRV